ncbi:MAG: phosphogluconate dehydratase [Burkholderiales bacterium]|jgi:phosphogluconate dehydratase|nr:phosphogluconate dehydratase [Burkholderiales bacterium]
MTKLHNIIEQVTQDIIKRSHATRQDYLSRMQANFGKKVKREQLGCTNLAHAIAAEDDKVKFILKQVDSPNIGIVTAYNDMLSAHQPYYRYPEELKAAVAKAGGTAQVAGGVPAMCDGVTQGQAGMELSLFSRDVIALSTIIGLSHNVFDGVMCLGICDKIVPGLLMGALSFGYLPTIFIPSGPMPSGISNKVKAETRKLYAEGKVGQDALLESELKSYHAAGTCTFYGTANSNQMLMEIMGLHVPGSAFITPNTPLRHALTEFAAKQIVGITSQSKNFIPLCEIVTEKSIVNAIIGLIATGGSTNHTIHLPAIAKACGILINWDDFAKISHIVPSLTKVYPNGEADVNQFHAAGGVAYVISELLDAGLLHEDVMTVMGRGLSRYTSNPMLEDGKLVWKKAVNLDEKIVRPVTNPFAPEGGLRLLTGNLGRAMTKISAIAKEYRYVKAPAAVFNTQDEVIEAYKAGKLNRDCIVVLCYQGPRANGMPELHGLTPALSSLQDKGYKVGLVTDGRMSGASGKIPNAIHIAPESLSGGNLAKIIDGDIVELDLENGILHLHIDDVELNRRSLRQAVLACNEHGLGRELFTNFRANVTSSETGATSTF